MYTLKTIMYKINFCYLTFFQNLLPLHWPHILKFYKSARCTENRALGRLIDNHKCQLLARMGIDDLVHIIVKSEENWKLFFFSLQKHLK